MLGGGERDYLGFTYIGISTSNAVLGLEGEALKFRSFGLGSGAGKGSLPDFRKGFG